MASEMELSWERRSAGRLGSWIRLGLALTLVSVACIVHAMSMGLDPVRFGLIVAALILAGNAVERMVKGLRPDEESRLEVGSSMAVASLVPLLGYLAVNNEWDSARMLLVALIVVGVIATGLILLPVGWRKVAVIGLILLHFGGILTAVTSIDTPGQPPPWLSSKAWVHFYRPYLGFMYLNNAYHFYSPEPGPPTLLYAYVIYQNEQEPHDLKGEWFHFPDKDTSPVALHYQRLLSMCESINQMMAGVSDPVFNERYTSRQRAAAALSIPLHPTMPVRGQYTEPQPYSKMLLAAYARHLARIHTELTDDPRYKFYSVKLYKVIHSIIEPQYLALGYSPTEESLYYPFFQGEFNARGEVVYGILREPIVDDLGKPIEQGGALLDKRDPFLYWLIPIWRTLMVDQDKPFMPAPPDPSNPKKGLMDYLEIHAKYMPAEPKNQAREEEKP